jgi:Domain of unknown function (DUF3854)/Domain of unknown function (DUF927)
LIPLWDVRGEIGNYHLRPDEPRVKRGRPLKYELPAGSRTILDVPPAVTPILGDPKLPLIVTEGARKADAAVSAGLHAVDLIGVWNFRGTNDQGGKALIADFEAIAFNGRRVLLCFDSDVMVKPSVHAALERLKPVLERFGAAVEIINLPAGEGGAKVGLDDYLAAGHDRDELLALASPALRPLPTAGTGPDYEETEHGMVWHKRTDHGDSIAVQLTNFSARIATDITEDDGAERRRIFEIEGGIGGRSSTFQVPAPQFDSLGWVAEQLGAMAIVEPGVGRGRVGVAIQTLSGEVPERTVYAHTGWVEIDGSWVYLHGGGAITAQGLNPDLTVALPDELNPFRLPDPSGDLAAAFRASLALLELAPPEIVWPVLAAPYRAALGGCDFGVHLAGPTGHGKTELAARANQHFGAGFDSRNLPASWHSTANALEGILFAAKDSLVVIDDFAPGGTAIDVSRSHRDADRVYRAAGNQLGRSRMRADASLRPPKIPRCLPLGTGEDVPRGESLQARLLVVHVPPEAVEFEILTAMQSAGADGAFALAMAGYLRWLAPDYGEIRDRLRGEAADLRTELASQGEHRRTPAIVAGLLIGVRYMLDFGQEIGTITPKRAATLFAEARRALLQAVAVQRQTQQSSEPAKRFVSLIGAALVSGRAHVSRRYGGTPKPADHWGWREVARGEDEAWEPRGDRIGWLDDDDLYLEPEASLAVAQRLARDEGEPLAVTAPTLHRRLNERGYLVDTELDTRGTFTVRKVIDERRRAVLHLPSSRFSEPDEPASDGRGGE